MLKWLGRFFRKYRYPLLLMLIAMSIGYWYCIPSVLFNDPLCTVLTDRNGQLLSARIAADGQWRFPDRAQLPPKLVKAIIQFEDRSYYNHPGISAKAVGRAIIQNTRAGTVKSGGSTLTMQLARMVRQNPSRHIGNKLLEMIMATRIELSYSKEEILCAWFSHAPFGGNVVGLDAASWRYFGRSPEKLSWAEAATLAVLPNAPSLIFPGKNHELLRAKRNRLLKRLHETGEITQQQLELALAEPLPQKPHPIPQKCTQLLDRAMAEGKQGQLIRSNIDGELQEQVMQVMRYHHEVLRQNEIRHMAALVIDLQTNEVTAYVGNTADLLETPEPGSQVDVIRSPRSTGSILKPLLYAAAMQDGLLTPNMLLPDIPTHLSGFSPKNFNRTYDGAVPANQALARSLNIPAVKLLGQYGVEKFHFQLKKWGMQTLFRPAKDYGLALILGGAEGSLWDITNMYGNLSKSLWNQTRGGKRSMAQASLWKGQTGNELGNDYLEAAVIWQTLESMVEVSRPDDEIHWKYYSNGKRIAWKTGTSFGYRDAWSVGITPRYAVGVWVGNAQGDGRPGLTGIQAAAPLLFDLFSKLPASGWFPIPEQNMETLIACRHSGHLAGPYCSEKDTLRWPKACINSKVCPYHQLIHLDAQGKYRVDEACEAITNMKTVSWFVLPPAMEAYFKYRNPSYRTLPAFRSDCLKYLEENNLALIYPKPNSRIVIPKDLNGQYSKTILEAVHRKTGAKIYWHLDDVYLGTTQDIHQLEINPPAGKHRLTLVDEWGISLSCPFEVLGEEESSS